jgi:heme exporter protein A
VSEDSTAGLNVNSLEVWRGERRLFGDLSFELSPGEIALVTGANGSGKTTLLRIMAGLSVAEAGNVTWRGCAVHELTPEVRPEVVYQGHLEGLKKDMTVVENLEFYRALWGVEGAVEPLLEELGLVSCAHRELRYLSAGQRRRASLGCMRLRKAHLWLLDEPLTNLDAAGTDLVAHWLDDHASSGGVAVVATHLAERLRERVAVEVDL